MKLVCFDTETTGLDVQNDHIIQLSLVKFDTDDWRIEAQRDWYILPEGEFTIPAEAEAVHHISKAYLQEHGVRLADVYDELVDFTAGLDMLSYNGNGFDAPILYYNLKRIGRTFAFEGRTWYDALLLERQKMYGLVNPDTGDRYSCNLTATYTRYYGHPFEGAHNSLDDVMATIEVFKAQVTEKGWEWVQRDDFQFISYDRWLTKQGNYYYLNQGAHKGESIETMLRVDKSYLEWIVDKCKWTDRQTRDIILPYLTPSKTGKTEVAKAAKTSSKKPIKKGKPTLSEADLSLF